MGPAAASGSRFRRLPAAASGLRFRRLLPPPATSLRDVRGTGHSWSEIHFRDRGSIAVVIKCHETFGETTTVRPGSPGAVTRKFWYLAGQQGTDSMVRSCTAVTMTRTGWIPSMRVWKIIAYDGWSALRWRVALDA